MTLQKPLEIIHHFFSLNQLLNKSKRAFILPFYHTVSSSYLPHIANLYKPRSIELFKNDINFFRKNFDLVSIDDLFEIISSNAALKKPVMHLTFDDGLKEIYSNVAPILSDYKIPATVFLNSAFIDNKQLFYRFKVSLIIEELKHSYKTNIQEIKPLLRVSNTSLSNLKKHLLQLTYNDKDIIDEVAFSLKIDFSTFLESQRPYLTSKEILELKDNRFEFGAHSVNHPFFTLINENDKKQQVEKCFEGITKYINNNRFFAFPFSDYNITNDFLNWLHKDQNCKLTFGTAGIKDDTTPYNLQRIPMEINQLSAEHTIKSELLNYLIKKLVNRNTIYRG